ncbi:MAG: cytochrome c [Planctomycetes bacterium]|nr:cytochrome c [Planctomycetota bacterium]
MSNSLRVLSIAAGLALGLNGCGFETRAADLRYGTQESSRTALAEHADVLVRLETGLVERFGEPVAPRYPALAAWADARFDPAQPERAADAGGSGELSGEALERVRADNAKRFVRELAAIERGDFDDVAEPRGHPALFQAFRALVADPARPLEERRIAARALFLDFYPTLAESAELYRIECLHCHGTAGGGDGPTANFLEPRPRDFRRGVFKWTSVKDGGRPTRADLVRVLELGVYGTSMPSFRRLSEAERQGLADYARFLAVRGEVERQVVLAYEDEEELTDATFDDALDLVWGKWEKAPKQVVTWSGPIPEPTPEAIALGDRLFHDAAKGNCSACHGNEGRGDGPVAFKIDDRGRKTAAYQDAWGFDILPRNLRRDPFRGGRRPIDLYRRIHAGINGGPMPAMSSNLTADEIWALVHYTRTLAEKALEDELAARAELGGR